jgi:N-methylhydantoinase A
VLTPIDLEQVRREVAFLASEGCEAIAVVLLHAYQNSGHERKIGNLIAEAFPKLHCSLSHEVAAEWREYERTSTVTLNAYVAPAVERYVKELEEGLRERGYRAPLNVMQSTGGATAAVAGKGAAIRTLDSGPAGGVVAAADLARTCGLPKVIAADVGGTSFDVSLIIDGVVQEKSQTEVDRRPILAPTLDIVSVGAGGGSIAWVDTGGALQVGPESAQAVPGPASFGRGGERATVTDAYAVLGLLSPDFFLGDRMHLDVDAARHAIAQDVGKPLGLDPVEAADAVVRLAAMNMVFAIRRVTVERGHDPREFTLVAYGGGGGMFASLIAHELEIGAVVVPRLPANFSAWGILSSDFRYDNMQHLLGFLDDNLVRRAATILADIEAKGRHALRQWGHPAGGEVVVRWFVEVRYFGQEHTLRIPLAVDSTANDVRTEFERNHQLRYSHAYPDQPVEIVSCRVAVNGIRPKPSLPILSPNGSADARKGTREVFFPGAGLLDCNIYDRELLGSGSSIEGPAIVEEWTSTTVVPPGDRLSVDTRGNLVIATRSELEQGDRDA